MLLWLWLWPAAAALILQPRNFHCIAGVAFKKKQEEALCLKKKKRIYENWWGNFALDESQESKDQIPNSLRKSRKLYRAPELVSPGCHDKNPQTGGLQQKKFISHSSGAGSPHSKCQQCWFLLKAPHWLVYGHLPSTSSHSLSSVPVHSCCFFLFL